MFCGDIFLNDHIRISERSITQFSIHDGMFSETFFLAQ